MTNIYVGLNKSRGQQLATFIKSGDFKVHALIWLLFFPVFSPNYETLTVNLFFEKDMGLYKQYFGEKII